jgi:predicted N-acetyltransferase YhbS
VTIKQRSTSAARVRRIQPRDATACGRIIYAAFNGIAQRHGFPPDFPSTQTGIHLVQDFTRHPEIYGVVYEAGGRVRGSNFLDERSAIRGVGPLTVDPAYQQRGVGRSLMQAVLRRARGAAGVRLVQDAFNTASYALYASLGFCAVEPLVLMQGRVRHRPVPGYAVRPATAADLEEAAVLCRQVHGFDRARELRDALGVFQPFVARRRGALRAYASAVTFWPLNHAVARTDADLQALLLGAAAVTPEPLAFLVPTRRSEFFRWCLGEGLRIVKPLTLMARGQYEEPAGAYYPSVMF